MAESFYGLSPYNSMGNNPISITDPDGDFAFAAAAIVGIVSTAITGLTTGFDSFGAFAGAFVGNFIGGGIGINGATKVGTQLVSAGVNIGGGFLPSANVNLGGGFSIGISPALMSGSQGVAMGMNINAGYQAGNFNAGISFGGSFGYSSLTKSTGFGGRFGGGIAYDGSFYASLSTMKYFGGGISQRTGTIGLGGGGFKLHYENDFHVLGLTNKMKISDGGDRWRTAAITASYGDLSVGFTLFTGDPGPSGNRPFRNINGHYTYVAENGSSPDQYRFGAAFIGYKNYRAGWNSEGIRHVIQNRVAHDILTGGSAKWFKRLDPVYPGRFYGGIFNNSKYSLWE